MTYRSGRFATTTITLVLLIFWIRSFVVQDEIARWRRHADGAYTIVFDLKSCMGEIAVSWERPRSAPFHTYWRREVMSARKNDLPVTATLLGFAFDGYTTTGQSPSLATTFVLPYWVFVLLFGTLSIWTLIRTVTETRKQATTLCTQCKYDLGATPERCPECGFIT